MPTPPLRVAIVAYSPLVRHGLAGLLAQHRTRAVVVDAAASDGQPDHHDVTVYDLSGLAHGTRDLVHLVATDTAVVGLVHHDQQEAASIATTLGVSALVPLDVSSERLIQVVETVAEDDSPRAGRRTRLAGLSAREIEILAMIAGGLPNLQIAKQLYLSPNSVKTYIRSAYRKIGAATRSQAVLWAVRHGLADQSGHDPRSDAEPERTGSS